jgi:2-phospho-L-lactate guanylyltransferase
MAMWLLIPIKSLEHSKQRLAGVLPAAERRELALAMLQDVLQAVRGASSVSHILVVTSDGELATLLGSCGVEILPEPQGCKGLNGAIAAGVAHAQNSGATEILVLHGDLPLASASEIDALAASHTHGAVTLVPDSAGSGTNGLLLSLPTTMTFHFGEESFRKHCHAAEGAGALLQCGSAAGPDVRY